MYLLTRVNAFMKKAVQEERFNCRLNGHEPIIKTVHIHSIVKQNLMADATINGMRCRIDLFDSHAGDFIHINENKYELSMETLVLMENELERLIDNEEKKEGKTLREICWLCWNIEKRNEELADISSLVSIYKEMEEEVLKVKLK